jgi:hypothetical protein
MEIGLETKERPDVFTMERTSRELVKLIRKLRWVGMEEEAKQMQSALGPVHPATALFEEPFVRVDLHQTRRNLCR